MTPRVKESIKTALAMTIAYGIALSMDWDRPYWAGFAVAFISLSTIGQSLNKGAMRMLGTLVALVVSLLIIALFVQEGWLLHLQDGREQAFVLLVPGRFRQRGHCFRWRHRPGQCL